MCRPITKLEFAKLIKLASYSLVLGTVSGYYEQTWIQIEEDDLAGSSVISLLYAPRSTSNNGRRIKVFKSLEYSTHIYFI